MANLHKHMAKRDGHYLHYIINTSMDKYDIISVMFILGFMNIHQVISILRTIWTWVCSLSYGSTQNVDFVSQDQSNIFFF